VDRQGAYIGEGFPPVPAKLASKIRQGDFIEMGELLSEFWLPQKEEDGNPKLDGDRHHSRLVTDIFIWLFHVCQHQSFAYSSHAS